MKPTSIRKVFSVLLILVLIAIGVIYLVVPALSFGGFSTSYQDFPEPAPMPTGEAEETVEVPGLIEAFDISPDGGKIAIATSKELILYDLETLEEVHNLPLKGQVYRVRFSPDGSKLAASAIILKYLETGPLHVTVWDMNSWNILYEYESESESAVAEGALAWSPKNEHIAFSIPERGLSVVDVESGNEVASLEDFLVPPFDLSWSPDGSRLISTGDLGYGLRRWRVDTNQWVRLWDKDLQPAQQVAWSPDGKRIASGHFGGAVCIWNARNNRCEGFIRAHFNSVDALDWSPNSDQIATASGAIRLWDADTGEMSSAFGFYDGVIYKELRWFDPDTIATLETSYTKNLPSIIRFWDVATGDVKLAFRGWDNVESASAGGVMLVLEDVQISSDRTVLQVSLRFDTPEHSVAGQWNVTMTDSQGRIYPLTDITPQAMDMSMARVYQTVPLPAGERITLDLVSFPPPLARMPLMLDLSANPGKFTFDPRALEIGESLTLKREIQANGYLLRLTGARKPTANELLFEFDAQGYLNGVMLFSPSAGGASTNLLQNNKIVASLSFSEMPNEPIEIDVTKIFYDAFGSWALEFEVVNSMFADLPASAAAPTPTSAPEPKFMSQAPIFLEAQALTEKFNQSILQGPSWVRVVSEIVTENLQTGQDYPPPYYREEQWFEVDAEGWVTRNVVIHWSEGEDILQQSISVGSHTVNLTTGEAMEFPMYRLSLDWILLDLDYASENGEYVTREETACEDGSPCLLISMCYNMCDFGRRVWINMETGQQVNVQSFVENPDGTENILYTQTFLPVEQMDIPPPEILDLFEKALFPVP